MAFKIKRVLISEPVDSCCARLLTDNGVEVVSKIGLSKEELLREIQSYDGLVVRSATKVTDEVIAAGKNLKVIGRAGTGVDNIDCESATRNGVLVINAPGGNTLSAAELTCGMVVTLSRNIPEACASVKSGKWDRKSFMGHELGGKTLAIVGLGRIGREVAHRMQAFGMRTIGFDPLVPAEASLEFGVESLSLEAIWPQADYITVHTPLIPQTRNLIGDEAFSKCKRGVRVVNCARGGIVDEAALVRALASGQCGGAGLDVYSQEPPTDSSLVQHPKVVCTPHLGASTSEAQVRVAEEIAQQIVDLNAGKLAPGIVNSPAFGQSLSPENEAWVALCKGLGAVLGALLSKEGDGGTSVVLTLNGKELSGKENVLKMAALVGFLEQQGRENVNFVNAPLLAKEAGIEATAQSGASPGERASSVLVEARRGDRNRGACGRVRGRGSGPRAVLEALDGAAFPDPPQLEAGAELLLCRGQPDATAQLLGRLLRAGTVHGAHWSALSDDGRCWCALSGDCGADEKAPEALAGLDFWARVKL